MVFYMCKYMPAEIFAGFGQETKRIDPSGDSFETADRLGHPNMCGYGKGILEAAMEEEVQELILVNCCDVARRVYDILKKQGNKRFLWLLDLPHKAGKVQEEHFMEQLKRLIRAYEEYSGISFEPEKARAAMEDAQNERQYEMRQEVALEAAGDSGSEKPYICLLGAHSGAFLREEIRKHFSVPVKDMTCTGERILASRDCCTDGLCTEDFLQNYTHALLHQTPCMRMLDVESRRKTGRGAAGIIYHTMKFCDYYSFEYRELLKEEGIPVLKIETDATRQSEGQLSTRFDAFAESLGFSGSLADGKEKRQMGQNRKPVTPGEKFYVAGVDSGSASTDAAILDSDRNIVGWSVVRTGSRAADGAGKALQDALKHAGLREEDLSRVVTTGYGRNNIGESDASVTEITCHAKGASFLYPQCRTIIDIGGQDSKAIRIDEKGNVKNFAMNDKCAAGTGRFMEMMARTMELSMEDFSRLGLEWKNEVTISSMCTVFAESEVVSLIADNTPPADIIHGLNRSVASRAASLLKRVGGESEYMMTGGVAANQGVVKALEEKIGHPVHVSEYSQLCGAIGAALSALEIK